MRQLLLATLVGALAACTTIKKSDMVPSGERKFGERLTVTFAPVWNEAPIPGPAYVWTMDGVPLDQMLIFPGIKNCQAINVPARGTPSLTFRSAMRPDEVVALFESMLGQGGSFKLAKVEPWSFAQNKGARFEFVVERRNDNLPRSGVGYAVVSDGELFAMLYTAPRLGFFERNRPHFETTAKSAQIGAKPQSADAPITACSGPELPASSPFPQNSAPNSTR